MSLNVTDSELAIVYPPSSFENLSLNLKVHSFAGFTNNLLKINFEQISVNIFLNIRFLQ